MVKAMVARSVERLRANVLLGDDGMKRGRTRDKLDARLDEELAQLDEPRDDRRFRDEAALADANDEHERSHETAAPLGDPSRGGPPTGLWGTRTPALVALGFNALLCGTFAMLTAAGLADRETDKTLREVGGVLSGCGMVFGALTFLPWLKVTYARARAIAPGLEKEWRRGPVMGFFIPLLHFVRPYQSVAALNAALDPELVPSPPPERVNAVALYRDSAVAFTSPASTLAKAAPVRLWWALWLGRIAAYYAARLSGSGNLMFALVHTLESAAALAAMVVVWRISERLREVERRRAALGSRGSSNRS